ncbi:MAG: hypothetical protein O2856_18600 [Planctomycetota bacterium]|nr:hypothetical protein [Planctomycetota bacterium]
MSAVRLFTWRTLQHKSETFDMISPAMPMQTICNAFEMAVDRWVTCDWPTEFGLLKLNLQNLRSFQLARLAQATSGQESQEWRRASKWVRKIEDDATKAQDLATLARDAIFQQDQLGAIDFAERAVQIELAWHSEPVWGNLLRAIQEECSVT